MQNDTTDNSSMSRAGSAPSLPNKPPTLNFGKPNLAPKPPVPDYNKSMSPTTPAPPPLPGAAGDRRSSSGSIVSVMGKRPSPPPKSPVVVNAQGLNWPTSLAPAPPPPGAKPNIARAQSLRSVSKENQEMSDQDHMRNQSSMDVSSPPHAPPPPPNRFATLPRNALMGGGAPRGPLPSVPRPVGSALSFSNGSSSNISPGKGQIRPSVRPPPPPPQRVNPPSQFPPPPPSNAPPPPPHRMSPAPLPGSSNGRTFTSPQSGGIPQPPTRGSSMRPSNGSVTSLTSLTTAPLPPPPPPSSALQADDFESRFASRFHPSHRLPSPEAFISCQKLYPTRQRRPH